MDLGFSEVLVILVFVLLIFGPDKLPEIARTLGKYYSQLMKYKEFLDEEIRKGMLEAESDSPSKKKTKKKSVKKSSTRNKEAGEEKKEEDIDEDLKSLAESLGISTEGKTRKEVIEEIKAKTVGNSSKREVEKNE